MTKRLWDHSSSHASTSKRVTQHPLFSADLTINMQRVWHAAKLNCIISDSTANMKKDFQANFPLDDGMNTEPLDDDTTISRPVTNTIKIYCNYDYIIYHILLFHKAWVKMSFPRSDYSLAEATVCTSQTYDCKGMCIMSLEEKFTEWHNNYLTRQLWWPFEISHLCKYRANL